ncbi:MAG: 2-C-methyl-D-erythritol 4-phosphate cytidylyltransferase [Alistipes sp.]|nr:2-C-methyl-D-erythritol 4-phosphate cytidylyltransferase [Alistipes sp.]MBR2332183.1 2-C-methyl-D-erythritol 4-phosphate cytidylyltransferase [Alistipes sp.]
MAKVGVIIVAGGSGRRMGSSLPKQFMLLSNEPILARSINRIHEALPKAEIVVVLPEAHVAMWQNLAARFDVAAHKIALGGSERFHSVKNGIAALSDEVSIIAVHDGVRPLASKKLIIKLILEAEKCDAVIPAIAPPDSYRIVEDNASRIIDRSKLRIIQTPQVFNADALRRAYEQEFSPAFTDDASVAEAAGYAITLCEGGRENIKITTPADIIIAEAIINAEDEEQL